MDNLWIIYALLASVSIGLVWFINKVIVEKGYNQAMSTVYLYISHIGLCLGLFFIEWNYHISLNIALFWILWWVIDYAYLRTRFKSLEWVSTSLFFISSRLFSSIALLILWIIVFWDKISWNEYIGFFIGFIVFWLLFEKERIKNDKYKRGLVFLWLGIILLIFIHFGIKYIESILDNLFVLIFFNVVTVLCITLMRDREKLDFNLKDKKKIIQMNILQSVFFFFYLYFLFSTYALADLGIAYKIQWYSVFVPIILSIFVYKEKVSIKQGIAFALTIVSLWFFIWGK